MATSTNVKSYSTKSTARRAAVNELARTLNTTKDAVKALEGMAFTITETGTGFTWIRILNENRRKMAFTKAGDSVPAADLEYIETYGTAHCPHCNVHLSNGVQDYDTMKDHAASHNKHNADKIEPITHEFLCLACEQEFGNEVQEKQEKASVARPKVNKSSVEGPCALVWTLAEKMTAEGARRKDVIEEAQKQGVAYYTARTQYQAWKAAKNKS